MSIEQPCVIAFPPRRARRRVRRDLSRDLPRERLLARGAAALSDAELIALLLGTGTSGQDVFALARALLARFGSLRGLLGARPADFQGVKGIGPARTALFVALTELARRALAETVRESSPIDSPEEVERYLRLSIGSEPQEVFMCLYLDARYRLLRSEESARGSLTRVAVYPREIVRRALELNAAALIVAHNHPSGAVRPSASDRALTVSLQQALDLIDVRLLDHLVIGKHASFSFAQAGLMPESPEEAPPPEARHTPDANGG
jgi:DNA repair protein RadC